MTDPAASSDNRNGPADLGFLISGRDPQWLAGCSWILGGMALIMGGLLVLTARQIIAPAVVMLATGGSLVSFSLILSVGLAGRRRYLRPTPTGFVYTMLAGERAFVDDDVMCVSLTSHNNYFAGNFSSVTRRFIMWVETGGVPECIVCIARLAPGQTDPLNDLIVRVIRGLHSAAREAYAEGQRVEGDGWALERNQLLLKSNRSTSITPVNDVAAVDIVEDQIRIWRKGEEHPVGRIPLKTANAHLLLLMLGELIPSQQSEQEAELPAGSLGRLLFERGPGGQAVFIFGWLISIALGISSLVVFGRAMGIRGRPRRRFQFMTTAGVLGLSAFMFAGVLSLRKKGRFRRHVSGIQQRGMFRTTQLRFTEIGNMSYVATRTYVHGVYAGTLLTLNFVPIPSTGLRPIRYSTKIKNADAELDKLRDDVSVVIAHRMHDFWAQNAQCPWMPFLRFLPDGLEYRALTFTGRKPPKVIPYASIVNFTIDESLFRVWARDQKTPVITEDIGQPNFYPGLVFLSELLPTFQTHEVETQHPSDHLAS
jgi:hypothetical protein